MKYNINVDDWYNEAILKKAQGYSNRKIAVMLFDNKNYRNRLNTFFKPFKRFSVFNKFRR